MATLDAWTKTITSLASLEKEINKEKSSFSEAKYWRLLATIQQARCDLYLGFGLLVEEETVKKK